MVSLISVAVYGLILYIASFRAIWGHHFEMALQPEKILLFFILEETYLYKGHALLALGDIFGAKQAYQSALGINGNFYPAQWALDWANSLNPGAAPEETETPPTEGEAETE